MQTSHSSPSDLQLNGLKGVRIAAIISDGFEQSEFEDPVAALRAAGAEVEVLAQTPKQLSEGIQGVEHLKLGRVVHADKLIVDADPAQYDGLLIPGGAISSDQMRVSSTHLALVRNFMDSGKPIAVICHGGWLLADSGAAQGVTLTSWPAIRKDLERAGAIWKDQEVIVDRNVVSSRKPADIPAFTREFAKLLSKISGARRVSAA